MTAKFHFISIFLKVVSQGNIIIGDELEMTSKQKTFAVALSREMVPTARLVVYYIRRPEELVTDVMNFFVNGTRQNQVRCTGIRNYRVKYEMILLIQGSSSIKTLNIRLLTFYRQ